MSLAKKEKKKSIFVRLRKVEKRKKPQMKVRSHRFQDDGLFLREPTPNVTLKAL